jgi:acetoacetyl-CoA synthetase
MDLLWTPPADIRKHSRVGHYLSWLQDQRQMTFDTYDDLWRWSVTDLDGFWSSIWHYFDVEADQPYQRVLADRRMPGAVWCPGARLNYAQHALRSNPDSRDSQDSRDSRDSRDSQDSGSSQRPALLGRGQTRPSDQLTFAELRDQVARARAGLSRLGVQRGDRVAAYLPNITETVVAFLATASLGAVWSSCAPEFGTRSVIDRFSQIEPKVLLAIDGYRYGSRVIDRRAEVATIRQALPTLEATVLVPYLNADAAPQDGRGLTWADLVSEPGPLTFEPVPFDHPLYILYSSGTTGLPKAIVHGHGGILLEHFKVLALHNDLGESDRFFWFTTTGWMMWNYLVSGLLTGSTLVLFDGDPAYPDLMATWQLAEETGITYFGTSAPFLMSCRKAGLSPGATCDLSALRGVGSTGSPLPPEGFRWVYENLPKDLILGSASGGTDVCTAFVGASPLVPVYEGEISCRMLGAKVEAFDPSGKAVIGELGELVITEPMPSMPVAFWNDPDGSKYRSAYFDVFPGVWRHGDWITITERGTCIITGRSDATLNRGGVRLGTAEFYSAVEGLDEVADSLVVHLEGEPGSMGQLLLFVVLAGDRQLDADLRTRISRELRANLSPRHVPDAIYQVAAVPRTLSGKKLEVPVKRILTGTPAETAASRGALLDPNALEPFERLAADLGAHP